MNALTSRASRFGLGTALGPEDDETDERLRHLVTLALSLGVRVFDTAVNYRSGRSERVLGQVISDAVATRAIDRSEVVLMTKGGYRRPRPVGGKGSEQPEHSLDPAFIRAQIDESSASLGVGIDVYFLHNPEEQAMVLPHVEYLSAGADDRTPGGRSGAGPDRELRHRFLAAARELCSVSCCRCG